MPGASASTSSDWRAWKNEPARVDLGLFPPELVVEIKALACELPAALHLPLSRLSVADVAAQAQRTGLVAHISNSTVWRWLHEDAIRPWQHRCWIFARDPQFAPRAGRILDLYARTWQGRELREPGHQGSNEIEMHSGFLDRHLYRIRIRFPGRPKLRDVHRAIACENSSHQTISVILRSVVVALRSG